MKITSILLSLLFITSSLIGQDKNKDLKPNLLKQLSQNACKCIDTIEVFNKSRENIALEISTCIDSLVTAYQLGAKLFDSDLTNNKQADESNKVDINININKNSDEYKKYYYELERYLMDNCSSLKLKIASSDKTTNKSFTTNKDALKAYDLGIDELKKGNYEGALPHFKKAVSFDDSFVFAWDNLGLCYRKTNQLDKALDAYNKSLSIEPNGTMPLQNIAIVYLYKKDYLKAIEAYEHLAKVNKDDPEVFYGIGNIYANYLFDYEKALDYMCKAYTLYITQKSPYRTDAEKIIGTIYQEMKKQKKEDRFNEILKTHNIGVSDK